MKEYLRESSEGVFKVAHYDSGRSGDIEIPEGATEAYYFDGSDPDGEIDLAFVQVSNKKLFEKHLCWGDVEDHNIEYIKKWGNLVWKRDKLQDSLDKYNATDHGEDFYKFDLLGNSIKPVKSDGGSSSYYFTALPEHLIKDIVERGGIEIKDIVRYCFDNDADCKDIIKALKRIRENLKGGGKEGVDSIYDSNKICFFAEELQKYLKLLGDAK